MLTDVGPTNIPTIFRTVHADLTWELCSFLCLDSAVVWYEGIQSGTLSPWWFSRFIWLFKGYAPKVLSMNALWTFVVCSLLYVEYFICPHYFGKSHRAQGGKQKPHFFFKREKSKFFFKACGNWEDTWRLSRCNWGTCQRNYYWKILQHFKIKFSREESKLLRFLLNSLGLKKYPGIYI